VEEAFQAVNGPDGVLQRLSTQLQAHIEQLVEVRSFC
jgi:hypothetical protein